MLTIFGRPSLNGGFCDGITRRDFLTIGGTLLGGGWMLPNLLRAEAAAGVRSHKAIINVFLPGGPPHLDMWDLKPNAPVEIRGEFNPITTNVPGIEICELFPQMATMMDKFIVIRSMVGSVGDHDAYQCMTGKRREPNTAAYWPSFGAWVSKVQGPVNAALPPHVSLMYTTGERKWGYAGEGGFLGLPHAPFRLCGGKSEGMKGDNLVLKGVTLDRLGDRIALRKSFDHLNKALDRNPSTDGLDTYSQQALGMLTSSALLDALDLSKEDAKVVERYGVDDPEFERDGAPRMVRNFCIARRLVEAGARVVTLNFSRFDWHGPDGKNFVQARKDFPLLDRAICSLVQDLHDRGLQKDVSVVVWGEFGRTPKINDKAGRDHWPQVSTALLAGGNMRTGQVIGATNRHGENAVARPVKFSEVHATLFNNVGLDLATVRAFDQQGRPQYPVEPGAEPIREVL